MTPLPTVELDPPTISMTFGVNDSPLAGRDGSHVSRNFLLICYLFEDFVADFILGFTGCQDLGSPCNVLVRSFDA